MSSSDFIVIKAEEDGVHVIGLTRGTDTKFHHSEKLDDGEVMIAQFTEHTSAMKIRGKASIHIISYICMVVSMGSMPSSCSSVVTQRSYHFTDWERFCN